jgi:hypothetical protein
VAKTRPVFGTGTESRPSSRTRKNIEIIFWEDKSLEPGAKKRLTRS